MGKKSQRAQYLQKIFLNQKNNEKISNPWDNVPHDIRLIHQSWCFKNNIFIYFEPIDWREGRIVIINNGEIQKSSEIYSQIKLKPNDTKYWEIVWKLYSKFYYENFNF